MSVNTKNPGIFDTEANTITRLKDYSLLKTTYGSKTTNKLPLSEWAKTSANPVRAKQYIEGEYQCVQFAIDFVKASKEYGYDTYVISVKDFNVNSGHAMVGLKKGDYIYQYDPLGNKDVLDPESWTRSMDPMSAMSTSLIKFPDTFINNINLMNTVPDLMTLNATLNKKILNGEMTTPVQVSIPMVEIYEPQSNAYPALKDENIDNAPVLKQYNMESDALSVIMEPIAKGLKSYKSGKYPALLSDDAPDQYGT